LEGALSWIKPAGVGKLYPDGFTNQTMLIGSSYSRPDSGRVLNFTNALVTFTGENLSAPFTNEVTLSSDNKFANLSSNKLALSVALPNGSVSGSALDPTTGKSFSFKGVVLQKQNRASGHFQGASQSGRISIDPWLGAP
jgi:hypothetical protein